jgi:hypothetical protein
LSPLRSVLEEVAATALEDLTVDDLAAEISEVAYGIQTLEVLMTRLVSSLTGREGHHTWLVWRHRWTVAGSPCPGASGE